MLYLGHFVNAHAFLILRRIRILGNTIMYLVTEGPLDNKLLKFLLKLKPLKGRTLIYVPSHYVAEEALKAGIEIDKILPHGIDFCEVPSIEPPQNTSDVVKILMILSSTDIYKLYGVALFMRALSKLKPKAKYQVTLKVPRGQDLYFMNYLKSTI
ncbi:hypothetical protein [Caldivirga maquilingensis]|nr:hypothetical protein [Caldivirga maquilingensis]